MKRSRFFALGLLAGVLMLPMLVHAEILAMVNYESKTPESLKALKLQASAQTRREGLAVIDLDPTSKNYGRILLDIPLPPDLVAHHLFYNKDLTKLYLTALGQSVMHVIDMRRFPYRLKQIDTPGCALQEDVIFSDDNKTWYLTCMGTAKVIVGNATTDTIIKSIDTPEPYPHGIAIHEGIDRILITSTVSGDLSKSGETITVIEASTGKVLSTHKVSNKPSPSGEAPVEIPFVPGSNPPVAYITNMFGGSLWAAVWHPAKKDFDVREVFDLKSIKSGVPLEMYFNKKADRLYLTSANPGHFHIFDVSGDATKPKLLKTLPAAAGAHHVTITPDERYAFVQNALLNLPGMSDGSITVIDLEKQETVGSIDTLKDLGFNPNSIVALPEWYHPAGH